LRQTIRAHSRAIRPLELQRWLKSLHTAKGMAWTTVRKICGIMHLVYKVGILHERVDRNPLENVENAIAVPIQGSCHHAAANSRHSQ
jgi:hypothetical protein